MRGLTLVEIVVVVLIIAISAAIVLPLLISNREFARRTQCAKNLQQIISAMYVYSGDTWSPHCYPTLSPDPYNLFAQKEPASEAMNLLYPNYITDVRVFSCPSDPNKPTPSLLQQIPKCNGMRPALRMTPAQTSYGYDPGHEAADAHEVVILADKPGEYENSDNHGSGVGQNVVFGTSVEFRVSARNPLSDGASDNNIYTLGDTTPGSVGKLDRRDDSFIRR